MIFLQNSKIDASNYYRALFDVSGMNRRKLLKLLKLCDSPKVYNGIYSLGGEEYGWLTLYDVVALRDMIYLRLMVMNRKSGIADDFAEWMPYSPSCMYDALRGMMSWLKQYPTDNDEECWLFRIPEDFMERISSRRALQSLSDGNPLVHDLVNSFGLEIVDGD